MRHDGPEGPVGRGASLIALGGLSLFPLVALGFVGALDVSALEALLLAGLVELLPALAVAQVPLALRVETVDRMSAYTGSAVAILAMGGLSLGLGLAAGGPARLGLEGLPPDRLAFGAGAVLLAGGLVVAVADAVRRSLGLEESPLLRRLIPRTPRERTAFVGLSFVAGFGEEVAFRGFAIPALAPLMGGLWGAAVFTSMTFGVLHAYQGPLGVLRTAAMGLVLAASFVVLGNLWPAVVAHVIIDLVGGLWLGPRITGAPPDREA